MHKAISILFGSNLPNLKNEEKMLSRSIRNAFEVSQASFLKSGPVNQFSCNKSVTFVASQLSCVSEVHQRRCTAGASSDVSHFRVTIDVEAFEDQTSRRSCSGLCRDRPRPPALCLTCCSLLKSRPGVSQEI